MEINYDLLKISPPFTRIFARCDNNLFLFQILPIPPRSPSPPPHVIDSERLLDILLITN